MIHSINFYVYDAYQIVKNAVHQEIAIRVFRTAHELSMRTVAIFSNEDRLSMHRYKVRKAGPKGWGQGFGIGIVSCCGCGWVQ